jgi:hypothetical protein
MIGSVRLLPYMPSWHAQEQLYLYLLIGDDNSYLYYSNISLPAEYFNTNEEAARVSH